MQKHFKQKRLEKGQWHKNSEPENVVNAAWEILLRFNNFYVGQNLVELKQFSAKSELLWKGTSKEKLKWYLVTIVQKRQSNIMELN